MELIEVIKHRRSVRKYQETKVEKEVVEDLIDMARLAPSAKNRQPWEFVIVRDKLKNQIAEMMLEKEETPERKRNQAGSSVKSTAKIMKQAPILILIFRPKDDSWQIGDALSIGAAIEHICLRATDLGLGSLWIRDTIHVQKEIERLVGYEDRELISAVSIGYADEEPKQRPRKKLEEVLKWFC